MKGFVQGVDRQQATLLPEYLDDWVDESNPVRAVDVFVDALELRDLGFDGVDPAATGRPAYHPSPMLKLYIYGYLNRVQSSRRLEREAGRNLEVMADGAARSRSQNHRRFPQGKRPCHQEGLRAICSLVPQDGSAMARRFGNGRSTKFRAMKNQQSVSTWTSPRAATRRRTSLHWSPVHADRPRLLGRHRRSMTLAP